MESVEENSSTRGFVFEVIDFEKDQLGAVSDHDWLFLLVEGELCATVSTGRLRRCECVENCLEGYCECDT